MVDGGRQFGIALEGVHQKDGAALVQGAGHPDGEIDADQQIDEIADDDVHKAPGNDILNTFNKSIKRSCEDVKGIMNTFKVYAAGYGPESLRKMPEQQSKGA